MTTIINELHRQLLSMNYIFETTVIDVFTRIKGLSSILCIPFLKKIKKKKKKK